MSTETAPTEPDVITDAKLDEYRSIGGGFARAARAVEDLTPADRALAWSDGTIRSNMCPGWRMADGIAESARDIRQGRPLRYIQINLDVIEKDPQGFIAAAYASGRFDS